MREETAHKLVIYIYKKKDSEEYIASTHKASKLNDNLFFHKNSFILVGCNEVYCRKSHYINIDKVKKKYIGRLDKGLKILSEAEKDYKKVLKRHEKEVNEIFSKLRNNTVRSGIKILNDEDDVRLKASYNSAEVEK